MNSSQGAGRAHLNLRIGVVCDDATTDSLRPQASRHGVTLTPGEQAPGTCDVLWQLAGTTPASPELTETLQTGANRLHAMTLVTGFGPPHQGDGHLPLLRLPSPGVDGSLAELTPPAQGTDALPDALAASCSAMGYLPIVLAGTQQGFATRTAYALMIEAMALLGEGVAPDAIEAGASAAGLRQPPLLMLDYLGLKVLDEMLHAAGHDHGHGHHHGHDDDHAHDHHHSHDHDHHDHGASSELMPDSAVYVLEKMAHGFDRMGAAGGYGFYEHEEDGSAELWDGLDVFSRGAKNVPAADITDRLLFSVAIEAMSCVREGLLASADADQACAAAGVFPPVDGGISGWREGLGDANFASRAAELASRYGKRFEVSA